MPVPVAPGVHPQAAGDQPGAGSDRAFGIDARDQIPAAGHAALGGVSGDEAEQLVGLALGGAGIEAQLPAPGLGRPPDRAVDPEAVGRRGVLQVSRRGGGVSDRFRQRQLGELGLLAPDLKVAAQAGRRGLHRPAETLRGPLRAGEAIQHPRALVLAIGRHPRRNDTAGKVLGVAGGGLAVVKIDLAVGRASAGVDRIPAVGVFPRGADEQIAGADTDIGHARLTLEADLAAGDVRRPVAGGQLSFLQRNGPGQSAGAIGTSPRATHHRRRLHRLRGQIAPDHPAAEGIALRDPVQGHQGPAGGGRGDRAQRHSLDRRIGRQAGGATKQRQARHLLQRLVQARLVVQSDAIDLNDREGLFAHRRRKARGAHGDGLHDRRLIRRRRGGRLHDVSSPSVERSRSPNDSANALSVTCLALIQIAAVKPTSDRTSPSRRGVPPTVR